VHTQSIKVYVVIVRKHISSVLRLATVWLGQAARPLGASVSSKERGAPPAAHGHTTFWWTNGSAIHLVDSLAKQRGAACRGEEGRGAARGAAGLGPARPRVSRASRALPRAAEMIQQAAAAAALKGRKKREKNMDVLMTEMLQDFFASESAGGAAERAKQIEEKAKGKLGGTTVAFDSHMKKSVKHEKQIDGLVQKVTERMARSGNYNSFASICVFFVIYVTAVMLQQDTEAHNAIQSAFQATILAGLADASNSLGSLVSPDDLLDWLQNDFVDRAWDDPICGDGTCEFDGQEYPGFGRFGCIPDCGRYLFTTKITVDLQVLYNASRKVIDWNLVNIDTRGRTPDFKWNIYSYTMDDFLLAEDARPEDGYCSCIFALLGACVRAA